jgi:hypothetical protein
MKNKYKSSIIIFLLCLSSLPQLIIQGSACSVLAGTSANAFMTIYNKNGTKVEENDMGSSGWGPDCQLGKNIYQYNENSFFLIKKGKLLQYKLDSNNHSPVQTHNEFNASNDQYFYQQFFTGITENYVYFANQTIIEGNWTILVNILIQNSTNSVWKNYSINVMELLLKENHYNTSNEIFIQDKIDEFKTTYFGNWMLNWIKIFNKSFLITTNLENEINFIYLLNNEVELDDYYTFSILSGNGKYLISFSDTFSLSKNEIYVLNLISLKNYTLSIPSTNLFSIEHLITYNPKPILVNNVIFIKSYPMNGIFKIDLDTNATALFFNSTNIPLAHFSILEPFIFITCLKFHNDISSFWIPAGLLVSSLTIILSFFFLLRKIRRKK